MDISKKIFVITVIAFFSIALCSGASAKPNKLPGYGVDLSKTSVSGLSSGAFMTVQFHVAYSNMMVGAGVVAGGPYFCSGNYEDNSFMENALSTCMKPIGKMGPDSSILYKKAKQFQKKGWIDKLSNLKDDKLYVFTGANDKTVYSLVVDQTEKFYELAGLKKDNIKFEKNIFAGHAMITDNSDYSECPKTGSPYINDCDFIQSYDILGHIYKDLNPPVKKLSGEFVQFDQTEFFKSKDDFNRSSMNEYGYLYVPDSCTKKSCKTHLVFHGCLQGVTVIGDKYFKTLGYNELADSNDIVVLYPQVKISNLNPPNPDGCWDWWGYSAKDPQNPDFHKKSGVQMAAVMNMLQRLGTK
ncbi:MAG: poly(3-hydroxybutyrate) depolymerase [Desulfobacteraceae bacterium]|nr:poly(3-hydroxybutyrate) depolymerase [Desulfobacteraceae bacterium]